MLSANGLAAVSLTIYWKHVDGASAYSVQYAVGTCKTFKVVEVSGDQLEDEEDVFKILAASILS